MIFNQIIVTQDPSGERLPIEKGNDYMKRWLKTFDLDISNMAIYRHAYFKRYMLSHSLIIIIIFFSPGGVCCLSLFMEDKQFKENGCTVAFENTSFQKMVDRAKRYVGRLNYNHFNFPDRLENLTKALFDEIMLDRAGVNPIDRPHSCPDPEQ